MVVNLGVAIHRVSSNLYQVDKKNYYAKQIVLV